MKEEQPKIGQEIYVGSELYLNHGLDDLQGGLTQVIEVVQDEHGHWWVEVEVSPGEKYNWDYLQSLQSEWQVRCGKQQAQRDPDSRDEFN